MKEIDVPIAQVDRFTLRSGDVLLTEGGDFDKLGRGALWTDEIEGCVHQNHVFAVRVNDPAAVLPEFLACDVQSARAKKYFLACAKQTTNLASINSSQLKNLPIVIPPPTEQAAIVEALRTWDTAIQKSEQLTLAKTRKKLAAMRALLTGERRLKGFESCWAERQLGELFQERTETGRADLPLLSLASGQGIVPQNTLERRDISNEDKAKYLRICPGDIGYNTMRMWQGVSALSRYEGIVSPAYTVCIPSGDIDGKFASYLFKLPTMINRFYRYSQGLTSDTWNLKFRYFAKIKLRIPEVGEQVAIASALMLLDQELELLRQLTSRLVQQKRGLMQKLLTGEWRLPLPEREAV
jgi:type I restriction enzyme S subunit